MRDSSAVTSRGSALFFALNPGPGAGPSAASCYNAPRAPGRSDPERDESMESAGTTGGDDVLAVLKALPHFGMVPPALLQRIGDGCRLVGLKKGDTIFRERDACRGFFAIRRGGVRLFRLLPDGREHVLHQLQAGQSFAEAAVLNHGFYPVTAEARATPTELIEVDGAHFKVVLADDPALAPAMLGSLCTRLLRLVERIDELSGHSAAARLAHFLLRLPSQGPLTAARVELPMAKKDLAAHLSVTPETLSRTLRQWKDAGWLETKGRVLVLRDLPALEALADGS